MRCVIDTCALINLANVGILGCVLRSLNNEWLVGEEVISESKELKDDIMQLVDEGVLQIFDGDEISAARYIYFLNNKKLGSGESECIAYCETQQTVFVSDNGLARKVAIELLGGSNVLGSIGLLRRLVETEVLDAEHAVELHTQMIERGARLPKPQLEFYRQGS